MADFSSQVPAFRFDPAKVTDNGSIPVAYRYDPTIGLVELGTDIDAELAAMYNMTSRKTDMDMTLNPLYCPVAQAFSIKTPYWIHRVDGEPFAFAGL